MTIRMIANKAHRYAGREVHAGEEYEVSGQSAQRLHVAMGWAKVAPAKVEPPKAPTYQTKNEDAGVAFLPAAKKFPTRRPYLRRDMTAETAGDKDAE